MSSERNSESTFLAKPVQAILLRFAAKGWQQLRQPVPM